MRYGSIICGCAATLLLATEGFAQTPGVTPEMIRTALPLEGAPRAVHGPYDVLAEPAFESPRHIVYRPEDLRAFPVEDSLPVLIWGNGGCAMNSTNYRGVLTTVASHGFVAIATMPIEGEEQRRANAEDLRAGIDWIEAENARPESPLFRKVATDSIAAMGTSCGGFMSIVLGSDPRVDTIGVFNSGAQPADYANRSLTAPTMDALPGLHGPVLLVNGHERDFLMATSRGTFDALEHVPTFYGARHGAGHTATIFHPGGGEFANVAVAWLMYHLKSDAEAGRMFVGPHCGLCTNENWDTDSKGMSVRAMQTAVTERTVMRHIAGSEAGDASVIRRDYADDAVVIFGNEATVGIDAVEQVFQNLYRRGGLKLDYETLEFEGEVAYTVWKTDGLRGSDSYIVRDGKIAVQTGIVFRETNGN